jgi:S1-C subfamily serine protease
MWKKDVPTCAVLIGSAVVGAVVNTLSFGGRDAAAWSGSQSAAVTSVNEPVTRPDSAFQAVVVRMTPSVVSVDAVKPPAATTSNKGKPVEESGSGVLVRFDGIVGTFAITNNHVIAGAKPGEITVTLHDGRIVRPARVVTDPESDIAVLGVEAELLVPAPLGDSDRVRVGQWVLAFGSPFGLNQTVTHGIISARDRGQISLGNTIRIKEFLQTDAAINPGSSGGPLVSADGSVIGINTAIASNSGSNSGVAFSIPINLVKRIARELIEKGVVNRGYLGVQLAPVLDPSEALKMGLNKVRGALVESVHANSPAAAGGLRQGDVILKLEAVELRDENHLINLISYLPANQKVRLSVWRERRLVTLEIVIGDWTATQAKAK